MTSVLGSSVTKPWAKPIGHEDLVPILGTDPGRDVLAEGG